MNEREKKEQTEQDVSSERGRQRKQREGEKKALADERKGKLRKNRKDKIKGGEGEGTNCLGDSSASTRHYGWD